MKEFTPYTEVDGEFLMASFLANPDNVACPTCGEGWIEVERVIPSLQGTSALVLLYCSGCRRPAGLDISEEDLKNSGPTLVH